MNNPDLLFATGGDWVNPGMPYGEYRVKGHSFAIRYVVPSIPGKMITRSEVNAAHAANVDMAFVYEIDGTNWRGGAVQGKKDGEVARIALMSLDAPESVACYHAVDESIAPQDMIRLQSWFAAVIASMTPYRAGIYGQFTVIEMAFQHDPQAFRWQTRAWSSGHVSHHADILQLGKQDIAGISVDVDIAYSDHFGQWYANPAKQPVKPEDREMPQGQIAPLVAVSVPINNVAWSDVMLYCDTGLHGNQPQRVRVAAYSQSKHYSQIEEVILTSADPHVIRLAERDVIALSFSRTTGDGDAAIGWTVA